MGGMGATAYAARHPGLFQAVASYSGALSTIEFWTVPTTTLLLRGFAPDALWGEGDPSQADYQEDVWRAHDPVALAAGLVDVPVFVSSGDGSAGPFDTAGAGPDVIEQLAFDASQSFSARLEELGGALTTDFYGPGTHSWPYWEEELHRSFPMLMDAIGSR